VLDAVAEPDGGFCVDEDVEVEEQAASAARGSTRNTAKRTNSPIRAETAGVRHRH
jgi:hypothetical protein